MTGPAALAQKPSANEDARRRARQALQNKNYDMAQQILNAALANDQDDANSHSLMADVHAGRGNGANAARCMALAINSDNGAIEHKKKFLRLARDVVYTEYNPAIKQAVLACLETPGVEFELATPLWASMLVGIPFFAELSLQVHQHDEGYRRFVPFRKNPLYKIRDYRSLLNPYFYLGIRKNVLSVVAFERFIVYLRHFLLEQAGVSAPKYSTEDYLTLTISVAHYAFHTDYILEVTKSEQRKIDALHNRIESGEVTTNDAASVALLACYVPLYSLKNAETVSGSLSGIADMQGLFEEQITDYAAVRRRAAQVEALTPVTDSVSEKVKAQYEDFPYPRWRELGETPFYWRKKDRECLTRSHATALIAGCGTGRESTSLAASFPNAAMLAIDITRSSLAYAIGKAETYSLKNITYRQADILKLGTLGRTFDYIESFGVLHHMEDPEKGWAVLASLLNLGGIMYIGLYSSTARRPVNAARAAIATGDYPPTAEGMRKFRQDSPRLLSKEHLGTLRQMHDYYYLNTYRDLLFHVQEHQFDIPRIKADLEKMGLIFEGFRVPKHVMAQFLKVFPAERAFLDLDNWHAFEQANPDTFLGCYGFWCCKP
jgi:2-polyprenyl-3-methyl-5-hydroxy-6-metoxy-1,4-benzoquinol methylase